MPKFSTSFHRSLRTIKHVFSGVPKISNRVSHGKNACPERVYGKTVKSGDPDILTLISSVSGRT